MNVQREPSSNIYDGPFYGYVMEPLLRGLHRRIAKQEPLRGRVLDAGCGTGGLALALADTCDEVVGMDLSPRHVRFAERQRRRRGASNVRFEVGDVSHLPDFGDASFDAATLVMALHEMPTAARAPVLQELARVARRVVVVDFQVPMPRNLAGWRNRAIERLAGGEHYQGFRDFTARGGLSALVEEAGLVAAYTRTMDAGTLSMQFLHAPEVEV